MEKLIELLDSEPLEDGVTHPVEASLRALIANLGQSPAFDIMKQFYNKESGLRPGRAACLLRCMGRLEEFCSYDPLFDLAATALKHSSLDIREAAIVTLETIGGEKAKDTLTAHSEPDQIMKRYLEKAVKYL